MAQASRKKTSFTIPVRVMNEQAARPAQAPVSLPALMADSKTPPKQTPKTIINKSVAAVRQPWSDDHKRKIMWGVVSVATVLVIGGWVTLWRYDFQSGKDNIFTDLQKAFKNFSAENNQPKNEPTEEIKNLTKEVFPQFENLQ